MYSVQIAAEALDDLDRILDHYIELELAEDGLRRINRLLRRTPELNTLPERFGRLMTGEGRYASEARFLPANDYEIIFVVDEAAKAVEVVGFLADKYDLTRLARRFG